MKFLAPIAVALVFVQPAPAYRPVTAEMLKHPADGDWLMVRRTYDGWCYSPLDQITPANVSRLRPVWVFSTAEARVHANEQEDRQHLWQYVLAAMLIALAVEGVVAARAG